LREYEIFRKNWAYSLAEQLTRPHSLERESDEKCPKHEEGAEEGCVGLVPSEIDLWGLCGGGTGDVQLSFETITKSSYPWTGQEGKEWILISVKYE